MMLALVVIGLLTLNYESYEYKSWHMTLVMWAFIVIPLVWNFYFRVWINTIEMIGGVCLIIFFITSVTVLGALAQRSTSEYVFKTLTHGVSGWSDPAICWGLGMIPPVTTVIGKLADQKPMTIVY
jgi:hypothetical protein